MVERDRDAAVARDARFAGKGGAHLLRDPHGHVDAGAAPLEGTRPLLPEVGDLEARGPLEGVLQRAHRLDARDAVDAHAGAAVRDQVPGAALEHEPERVDRTLDHARALAVADAGPAASPDDSRQRGQVRHAVLRPEPAPRVEAEEPPSPAGPLRPPAREG